MLKLPLHVGLRFATAAIIAAVSSCRSAGDGSDLLNREQQAYTYSNEIRRIESLRKQYLEQRETLEILLSELDRERQIVARLERDVSQTQGRVAALQGELESEKQKEKALLEEIEKRKTPTVPPSPPQSQEGGAPAQKPAEPPKSGAGAS